MGDVRDPGRDQELPHPGGLPVQAVLIEALKERMGYGRRKYGRPLETDNGRDPLLDAWEEMLDLMSYFTQFVLEQGTRLPGLEKFTVEERDESMAGAGDRAGLAGALNAARGTAVAVGALIPKDCPMCLHGPHAPGRCKSKALNLGCGCLCE